MLDKERLAKVLENKLEEGYDVINSLTVADKNFADACSSMFDIERTIKYLRKTDEELAFEKGLAEDPIKLKSNAEIEKALSKNEDIEVGE